MDTGNYECLMPATKQKIRRTGPGVAKRPSGFISLNLLYQDRAKKARHLQLTKRRRKSNMVNVSTQTDSTLVVLWNQKVLTTLRYVVPARQACTCNWSDYYLGRTIINLIHFLLVIAVIILNLGVLFGIYEKSKLLFKF
ncbi:uncharacterized protein LOC111601632 isoform X2 [Drosophila hydei]|uniref:Uncharacterized protein LOC111601632 isoform X2 n=1 Tax=Drosophila hydei TaxID=7224 RepID=A0A6J1MAS4_DROHY|nr:uncharacterized protein LOC111601632 isoform X2 [Drosophila hydei]